MPSTAEHKETLTTEGNKDWKTACQLTKGAERDDREQDGCFHGGWE
jgi:hypothetical protein